MIHTELPHTAKRRGRVLTAVAVTAAASLAFGFSAAPALADGARGSYTGNALDGITVKTDQGNVGTTLFNLTLEDGTVLQTYCIDFETSIRNNADYQEDDWANYPGQGDFSEPAKVHWILQNSFPALSVAELAEASGVEGLNDRQALAGTQAAIWHFSNGIELAEGNDGNVAALYEYLTTNAEDLPQTSEPDASLRITPGSAEGTAGSTIGEFTVETSAESVPLNLDAPEGVELVDLESGEPIDAASNGTTFGFEVPEGTEPGEASVSASVSTDVHAGRLFQGIEGQDPTQTLITAESGEAEVGSGATVTWTEGEAPAPSPSPSEEAPSPEPTPSEEAPSPSPSPSTPDEQTPPSSGGDLPLTGAAIGGLVAAGLAALGAGGAAMYFSRKRKSAAAADDIDG
ncbi:Cys-Gln thioester bond-forming surface protein [Nocardiopsis sediminis]|uniref:Cys-Gln thioester bond-forming surface protein n=1 Tax=Nocardiopsis sediminis TaxID=1778267 RepID=A0ABV8FGB6_9ACTN